MRRATSDPAAHGTARDPVGPNVEALRRTLLLVERLTDEQYAHVDARLGAASIGAHVRHVLDHYRLFLDGLPDGEVDYDARERDTDVERSAGAAAAEARRLCAALAALGAAGAAASAASAAGAAGWAGRPLRVRQQADELPGCFDGCDSHVERELLFLLSHAVHHQALIAVLARAQGLDVPELFGVAPSTAAWQRTQAMPGMQGTPTAPGTRGSREDSPCAR
jgi:uncharacterized damage-inducible protein DinB